MRLACAPKQLLRVNPGFLLRSSCSGARVFAPEKICSGAPGFLLRSSGAKFAPERSKILLRSKKKFFLNFNTNNFVILKKKQLFGNFQIFLSQYTFNFNKNIYLNLHKNLFFYLKKRTFLSLTDYLTNLNFTN